MSNTAFAVSPHASPKEMDEHLLESLLDRLSPSPDLVLKVAMIFASRRLVGLKPELILNALSLRGELKALSWIGKLDPAIGVSGVMERTGLSKSGVHKAKDEDRILAYRIQGKNYDSFPIFQFKEGKVRSWIPALLALTGNGLAGAHFLSVARKRLDGSTYIDLLRGEDDEVVISAMLKHAKGIGDEARSIDSASQPATAHT